MAMGAHGADSECEVDYEYEVVVTNAAVTTTIVIHGW